MLPEISRRCLSCGAAVRAGARFCPQCGKLMVAEEATPAPSASEVARADEGDAPAGPPPVADVAPAAVEEIRLEESWKRWEESVVAHADAAGAEAPARGESREVAGGGPPEVGSESRVVTGETAAPSPPLSSSPPSSSLPPSPPHLLRPQSAARAAGVGASEAHDDDGRGAEGATADAGSAGAPFAADGALARPRAGERGRRAAAVKESLRPRVERVRDASMGVLEEAAEDSGLRFVLIALALFAVFLVFLFINNLVK